VTLEARTVSVTIERPYAEVYAYLADPSRWPDWSFFEALEPRPDGRWDATVPGGGRSVITTSPPNEFGVLDHTVEVGPDVTVQVVLRVVPNQDGSQVMITTFRQPGMSDDDWARDIAAATEDQAALKKLLES
jgi:hypothetical protein